MLYRAVLCSATLLFLPQCWVLHLPSVGTFPPTGVANCQRCGRRVPYRQTGVPYLSAIGYSRDVTHTPTHDIRVGWVDTEHERYLRRDSFKYHVPSIVCSLPNTSAQRCCTIWPRTLEQFNNGVAVCMQGVPVEPRAIFPLPFYRVVARRTPVTITVTLNKDSPQKMKG